MGRGNRTDKSMAGGAGTRLSSLTPEQRAFEDAKYFIGRYERRVAAGASRGDFMSGEELTQAKISAMGLIHPREQAKLALHIQGLYATRDTAQPDSAEHFHASQLANRGEDLMLLAHDRFISDTIRNHQGRGAPEDSLRQACRIGMVHAIGTYDDEKPAGFLHWSTKRMAAEINYVIEWESGAVRAKSKGTLHASRVEQILKQIDNEGRQPSLAEVTARMQDKYPGAAYTPEKVADAYDWKTKSLVSFDAPVDATDGGANLASVIADAASLTEERALSDAQMQAVRDALGSIQAPVDRKVMELYYGLGGREGVEQKFMFDGVYKDPNGNLFTGEDSVVNDRKAAGVKVEKLSQKELDRLNAAELVSFEPGTPEARELFEMTGVPPTSGTIQYSLKRAREQMSKKLDWMRDDFRYRGHNEMENSDAAQDEVRRALVDLGVVTAAKARSLKVTRPAADGSVKTKGPLRVLAEQHNLVDDNGRVRLDRISAPQAAAPAQSAPPAGLRQKPVAPAPRRRPVVVREDEDLSAEDLSELMGG